MATVKKSKTETKKKSTAAKKVAAKKAVKKAQKRVAKKTPKKVAKKAAKKTPVTRKSKKTVAKKKTTQRASTVKIKNRTTDKNNDHKHAALETLFKKEAPPQADQTSGGFSVQLPSNVSLRALEKSRAIRSLVGERSARYVGRFAIVAALVFSSFGAVHNFSYLSNTSQAALTNFASQTTGNATNTPNVSDLEPEISFFDSLPSVLEEDSRVRFILLHTELITVTMKNVETGSKETVNVESSAPGEYVSIFAHESIEPGKYVVHVETASPVTGRQDEFRMGTFEVLPEVIETNAGNNSQQGSQNSSGSQPTTQVQNSAFNQNVPTSTPDIIEEAQTPVIDEEPEVVLEPQTFAFALSSTTLSGPTMILTTVPSDLETVEIYVRKKSSFTRQFLTAAEFSFNRWRFLFDTTDLPAGEYEMTATGKRGKIVFESEPTTVRVVPPRQPETSPQVQSEPEVKTEPISRDQVVTTREAVPEAPSEVERPAPQREFTELSLAPRNETQTEANRVVTELMRDRKSSLEVLLRNYSAAVQGNDPTLIRLAAEALAEEEARIVAENEGSTEGIRSDLNARFGDLRERIETFETLRRSSSQPDMLLDTDGDGITDLDEELLFNTDPMLADSDNDGFADAVEILRGFDPNDADAEVPLVFESPRETLGLERPDTLRVEGVVPRVVETDPTIPDRVSTVISGVGLPNSFVTLFIFSDPTIVTLRTDENGLFEYVFDKELDDGSHEVYVAVTDNEGSIVAQSEGFSFVKEAEAFTIGSAESNTVSPAQPVSVASQLAPVIGMGIIALGIVLLMLGLALRTPEEQETPSAA